MLFLKKTREKQWGERGAGLFLSCKLTFQTLQDEICSGEMLDKAKGEQPPPSLSAFPPKTLMVAGLTWP